MCAQTIQERFETFVCDCFTEQETEFNATRNLDILDTCFDFPMEDFEEEFEAMIAKNMDTTNINKYEVGYVYGKKMFSDLQSILIKTCDPYYRVMSSTTEIMFENTKIGVDTAKIDSLSAQIKAAPEDYNLVWERGANQMALGNNAEAISDFEICLQNDSEFPPALFFLGWVYDLNGDSEKALIYYKKVLNLPQDPTAFSDMARIKIAIIERNTHK